MSHALYPARECISKNMFGTIKRVLPRPCRCSLCKVQIDKYTRNITLFYLKHYINTRVTQNIKGISKFLRTIALRKNFVKLGLIHPKAKS